jgi:NAD(P)-dependent dehydrogenase (short-subunit alcohol dehydrogenase family)
VWLVGASSGIGRALAVRLHEAGARVVVSARSEQALEAFVAKYPGSLALPLDVTRAADVAVATRRVLADGPIDLICYCAGHYAPMRATAMDLDDIRRHHEINVMGAFSLLAATVPGMLEQGRGHVSLVSSVAGYRGLPRSLAYGPTKAALINLAETLYLDLQPLGVDVSVINPGFVETPLTANNDFEMPALITAEAAAEAILRGWSRGEFEIHFPKRFTRVLKLLRCLPDRLYFSLVRRITGE